MGSTRITAILESLEYSQENVRADEVAGVSAKPEIMALLAAINNVNRTNSQFPTVRSQVSRAGIDTIKIVLTSQNKPVIETLISLPGVVSMLSAYYPKVGR